MLGPSDFEPHVVKEINSLNGSVKLKIHLIRKNYIFFSRLEKV